MDDLSCAECGEEDDLTGTRTDETIRVHCGTCGHEWVRDLAPRCPTCGDDELEEAVKAVVEKSRGSQLSIVGTQTVQLCKSCDAELVASYRTSRSPLMPDDLPTTPR